MNKKVSFYKDQLILSLLSIFLGIITGAICYLFGSILLEITDFRSANYLFFLPFLGTVGVFLIFIYQKFGKNAGKGMSLLFEVHQDKTDDIPLRLVPMVIISTWMTHLFGGSAGREGVAVQVGGTIGFFAGRKLHIKDAGKIMMIAGMAAGFGGLFRTPLAATFFAIEVLAIGTLEYRAILPSLTAAFTASFTSGFLGLEKFSVNISAISLSSDNAGRIILISIAFGLAGFMFSFLLKFLKGYFNRLFKNNFIKILTIGTALGLLSIILFKGRYSGLGTNLINAGFTSKDILPFDFIVKLLFTVITLSAGFFGGEVTPLFSIGVSLGFILGNILGLPSDLCCALGYSAVFASASNTLIAPILIGAEVFGPEHLPFFALACIISYMMNGNHSIYPLQKNNYLEN